MPDSLIAFGGELKALGDGKVGGYLVRFGNENEPDLSNTRDWFAKSTYFGARNGDGCDTTINHGIPLRSTFTSEAERKVIEYAAGLILPPIKTQMDDIGIFASTILDLSNDYQAMVAKMIAEKRMLWSSGAVEHLVKRTPMANNTNRVDMWIIGEAAFTPTPAEPRLGPILSLKSLSEYQQGGAAEAGSTRAKPIAVPIPVSVKAQLPRPIPLRIR